MAAKSAPAIVTGFQEDTKGYDDLDVTNDPSDAVAGFPGMVGDSTEPRPTQLTGRNRLLPDKFTYSWKNLGVDAPVKKRRWRCWKERPFRVDIKQLPILRSLCGTAKSGELWALMGSSGAGKTTLLNSLNFRNQRMVQVTGSRCINGVPISPDIISSVSGYLQQDDLFPDCLSCRELSFTAHLRLPSTMSAKQRSARVDEVLHDVGLWHVKDVYIGGGFSKGISGGEKKRLAFAAEILTDPSTLFCDEPTSGLDSYMATIVVDIMKRMASRGKMIMCTYSPRADSVSPGFRI
jgi:ABC-type multidrug transport system ATPase subunit